MAGVADFPGLPQREGIIRFYPHWDLDKFLDKHKPSQETNPSIFWISVSCPDEQSDPDPDLSSVSAYWQKLTTGNSQIEVDDIKAIGTAVGYTSGKWMVFRKFHDIDDIWNIIAKATVEGTLGTATKVSSRSCSQESREQEHVICVYTRDFTDEMDVYRVEQQLRSLGIKGPLFYKADIYTVLGIYSRNPWGLNPSLYKTNVS